MGDEYLKSLNKTLKLSLEEGKKQNLIVDYKILLGNAATPQDFDILVMVESKNMAALDNGRERVRPDRQKNRGHNRTTAGDRSETPRYSRDHRYQAQMREITLK